MMSKEQQEYAVIKNAIQTISVLCAAEEDTVIDKLTGYLWDENEAEQIKKSDGRSRHFEP